MDIMKKFVIISTQRSGSTLLRTSLDSHPEVRCHGEVFLPHYGGEQGYKDFLAGKALGRVRNQLHRRSLVFEYLDQLYADTTYSAIGFKVMYSQLRRIPRYYPMILDYIRKENIGVMHHIRENPIATLISRYRLRETGVAHVRSEKDSRKAQKKVTVPISRLISDLHEIEKQKALWRKRLEDIVVTEITYEAFVENIQAESGKILEFLGVDSTVNLESPLKRIGAKSFAESVTNFDDMRRVIEGTEYEKYLQQS